MTNSSPKPRFARAGFKALLLVAACTFTLTAGGDCTNYNPQTFLDGAHGDSDLDSPLVDIDELDSPELVLVESVGDTFSIEVRALVGGDPRENTEARVNVEFDASMLELMVVCGGNDIDPHFDEPKLACREPIVLSVGEGGLTPAYHAFDNDGVMWFKFRALQEGETEVTFLYPGLLTAGFTGSPNPTPGAGGATEPGPATDAGYTEQSTTQVVIGGAPSDSDEDGVPDFEDDCPDTPAGEDDDGDGCPEATDEHPALGDIAPSSLVFRSENTSLACGFTDVAEQTAAASSDEGGVNPLRIDTFHPQTDPGPAPTTTVRGPYDPATGEYVASGTSAVGAEHELEGVWTVEPDGDPRFDGTLVERFLSPTCENTFDVTYTID